MARPIDYLLGNNIDKRTGLPMGVIGGNPSYMPSPVKVQPLPQNIYSDQNNSAYNANINMRSGNPIPVRPMTNAGVIQNTTFKNNAPTLLTGTNTGQANTGQTTTGLLGSSFNDPRSVGNFALASNLLQNSGYSTTPKTTGEIIGSGIGAYMKGRMAQEDRLSAKSQNSLKNQLEMAKYINDLQKMKLDQQKIGKEDSKTAFTQEKDLRKEFTGLAKPFRETITNFNKAYAFAMKKNPTGASDIALVFSFMKALDPRSVVRENEQATTENAGGVPAYIRNFYNKLATGQKFDPVVREEIIDASRSLVVGQVQSQKDLENEYKGYAERNKLSVDNVYTSLLPKSGTYLNPIKVSSTDEAEEKLKDGQFFVLPDGSIGDIQ